LYARDLRSTPALALTKAEGPDDANVVLVLPDDQTMFPLRDLLAGIGTNEVPIADPTQVIWDLEDLGGSDRLEAAGAIREWLLDQ